MNSQTSRVETLKSRAWCSDLFKMYLYENFLKGAAKRTGKLAVDLGR